MNVTELIKTLEYFKEHGDGHLQVFFNDHENGATPMNSITTEESITPRGIKYLLLDEVLKPESHKEELPPQKIIIGGKIKVTEETNQKIIKLSKEGHSHNEIAREVGCSKTHVHRTLIKQGIKKKSIKRGRPKKRKSGLQKEFNGHNVRCKKCGLGKPSTEYKGTWRVCAECRKR